MTDDERRYFSLEEANRTLPLVRRIVRDLVDDFPGFQSRLARLRTLTGDAGADGDDEEAAALRAALDRDADRINEYIAELADLGCLFKGFEPGLVDFFARYQGREIFLCWQLGESAIDYWHEIEGGYAGRQPITDEMAAAI